MMVHLSRSYRVPMVTGVLVVVASLIVACMPVRPVVEVNAQSASTDDPEQITLAVNAIWDEYAASLNAGDIDRWVEVWTEDGVQMPPDSPYIEGKEAIHARNAGVFAPFDVDMEISNLEVGSGPEYAFARGVYSAVLTPKEGGGGIPIDGKYMTILQQQPDGTWKVHRDIFNSNVPPAPSGPDVEAVTAEINALFTEYGASLGAGDADRWIKLWTEDGVQLPPGAAPNVGRDTIYASISGAMGLFAFEDMQIDVEEVLVAGDLAIARGMYTVTYVPLDGSDSIPVDGKYTTTFQRQPDGSWKIYRDIFNSNVPAP